MHNHESCGIVRVMRVNIYHVYYQLCDDTHMQCKWHGSIQPDHGAITAPQYIPTNLSAPANE